MLFLIYSKDKCKYCTQAKKWIEDVFGQGSRKYIEFKNPPFSTVDQLKLVTKQRTYPYIFCGSTFIGGYNELSNYINTTQILHKEFGIEPDF